MSDDEVLDCLDEIRRDPAYRPEGCDPGGGFSLAGMQPKIALRRTPEGWALPWGAEPTSHIIKITRSGVYDHEALMEHLTMTTARNGDSKDLPASQPHQRRPTLRQADRPCRPVRRARPQPGPGLTPPQRCAASQQH